MTNKRTSSTCPSCAESLPAKANFCPNCGTRLAAGGALPAPIKFVPAPPPRVHGSGELAFGKGPAPVLGGLSLLTMVAAFLMFAVGASIAGVVLMGISLAFGALFVSAINREASWVIAPLAQAGLERARSVAKLIAVAIQAWSQAAFEPISNRRHRHDLERELEGQLKAVGEAVYRDDRQRPIDSQTQEEELDRSLREAERVADEILSSVRDEIDRQWAMSHRTRSSSAEPRSGRRAHG